MTDSYLGWTVEELKDCFVVEDGLLVVAETGKQAGRLKSAKHGLFHICYHPVSQERRDLSCARVAYMIQSGCVVPEGFVVSCKDGDPYNLDLSNLVVVKQGSNGKDKKSSVVVATAYEGVHYHTKNGFYIVRRGPKQSIFRSFSLKECVEVWSRWVADNSLNEWDDWMPVAYQ